MNRTRLADDAKVKDSDGLDDMACLKVGAEIRWGVAIQWLLGSKEIVVACGTEENAHRYMTTVMKKEPHSVEIVCRDVVRICGPWEAP